MARYDLTGRVIAITGSTGGLGSEVVKALAQKGARLALFDIDEHAVEAQANALAAHQARGWRVDVRSMESLSRAMSEAARHFGRIDVVVANAGITCFEPLVSADPDRFDRVVDINLNGVWRTFRAGVPFVAESKGYLLAISSMAAFVHSPLQASYTASKAGVWAMCNSIRLEVKHLGVSVGSVHPTFFKTAMLDGMQADPAGFKLWGGNKSLLFKAITLESVVSRIVAGIEARTEMVVIPSSNALAAKAPGFFRGFLERFGFKQENVVAAINLALKKQK